MKTTTKSLFPIFIIFFMSTVSFAQDISIKIGLRDSIQSEILNETRDILIHLPSDYQTSNKSYSIMYQLDGSDELLFESVAILNRLAVREEIMQEIIIVTIENTNRARDMWPVNNKYYPEPNKAGAKEFLDFFEKELIPYIESKYRTNENKILCGQSLSTVFTFYAFLTKSHLFDSYIACSGGFPGCESYFKELIEKELEQPEKFAGKKLFITNGLKDPLDPNGKMNEAILDFINSIKEHLSDRVSYKYLTYENEGHVPFQSTYHGLKFIFESDIKAQ